MSWKNSWNVEETLPQLIGEGFDEPRKPDSGVIPETFHELEELLERGG